MTLHTILGANGVVARELALALAADGVPVRQVSRSPRSVNPSDEAVAADLLDPAATDRAVAGSDVAYLVAGLRYDASVWREEWPRVMRNVIAACRRNDTRLVFFDNVYAYGRVSGPMTEDAPYRPSGAKGEVRAQIATTLRDEILSGGLTGMIVRSGDFYGPGAVQSFVHATIVERLRTGKTPQWMGDPRAVHSFTYTPDAGRALAVLARSDRAWGRTWHVPTDREPITGEAFVRIAAELAGRPYRLQTAPRWMLRLMGLVTPVVRENLEMLYQFEEDYRFDSSATEEAFSLVPTPYRQGIEASLRAAGVPIPGAGPAEG